MVRKKKIKIQIEDQNGGKYSLVLEGNVDKTKMLKIMEFLDSLEEEKVVDKDNINVNSIGEKILYLIERYYRFGDFTSSKLLELYEDEYKEPIKLSVISTYLARFVDRNILTRVKGKNGWIYRKANYVNLVK